MATLRSRVIVAGEPTTGKTQLIKQVCEGKFNHNYMMTQGVEYTVKEVPIEERSYSSVELHLLDIAGQNIFKEITFDLLGKANQVMLVYDVTNLDSFQLLRVWFDSIKQQNAGRGQLSGIVVANKIDLEARQAVASTDGQAFANSIGFEFCEVSALQSKNIDVPFKTLADLHYAKYNDKISTLMDA